MDKKTKVGLGILAGGAAIVGGIIAIMSGKKPTPPTPPPGPASFEISVINLPEEATSWGCAFKDPATDVFYQPTNHPATGAFTFGPSDVAELSVPVSSGVLSISDFAGVSLMEIAQLQNYQIQMNVAEGGKYIFDFAKGGLS